jgi:putative Holliday junction resolvase
MRFIGIDYGKKRIGIAISDESGNFAFAHSVVENNKNAIKKIKKICEENNVAEIILGQSFDFKGLPNPIMKKIDKFKSLIEKETKLPVVYESETLTTKQAERIIGRTKKTDASAAALILNSYLEKQK